MPYDNPYNKRVAEEVQSSDERYILNLDRQYEMPLFLRGSGSSGGRSSSAPIEFNDSFNDRMIQNVLRGGCGCCGGSGFGKMTRMDTGFEKSLGSAEVKNFRPNTNNTGGVKTMEKENPELCDDSMEGSGTKELKDDLNKFDFNRVKDWVGLGKHLKLKGKGWEEFKKDLGSFDFNKVKSWVGLGKYGKANTKIMTGSGFWEDFKRGFNMVFEPGSKYLIKPLATATGLLPLSAGLTALGYGKVAKAKRGRKSKMGNGLNMQPIPNANPAYQIARPDEAWKLKKDRLVPMKEVMLEGSGTKELKDDVNKFDFNRIKDWIGMAKPKDFMALKKHTMMSGKGWEEFKKDLGSFDFNKVKSWIGLGKYGKANSKRMMGASWWDSFTNFFKNLPNTVNSVVLPIANKINDAVGTVRGAVGLGKKNKMGEGASGGKANMGEGVSGGKAKKAPSAKQLEARRKFTEMVKAKAMMKKNKM